MNLFSDLAKYLTTENYIFDFAMNAEDHLDVASGAIVPSSCGELAFRVIKKVSWVVSRRICW